VGYRKVSIGTNHEHLKESVDTLYEVQTVSRGNPGAIKVYLSPWTALSKIMGVIITTKRTGTDIWKKKLLKRSDKKFVP